jgi:YggT family protein
MNIVFESLISLVNLAFQVYILIVIGRILISWVNPDPYNPIVRFLSQATDPLLFQIRRVLPLQFGAFDLTPIVLIFGLQLLQRLLLTLLGTLARSMGVY